MTKEPQNGSLIKCDRCRCCHRLTTPTRKSTGRIMTGLLAFNCNGKVRIASVHGNLTKGLQLVSPIGEHRPKDEDIVFAPKQPAGRRRGKK